MPLNLACVDASCPQDTVLEWLSYMITALLVFFCENVQYKRALFLFPSLLVALRFYISNVGIPCVHVGTSEQPCHEVPVHYQLAHGS
jgi:hypothetical protein